MVSPLLFGFVLLATLQPFVPVNAAPQAENSPAPSPDTPSSASSTLVATANLAGGFNVTGRFQFALQGGNGPVAVSIELDGLNALNSTAMYTYHIHTNPISSNGNCSSALGHLDPLAVTDALVCSPQMSKYCEEGDLSGRNGRLNAQEPTTKVSYVDNYLRFWPQPFSILGRSVVIHLPNTTRVACGNITSVVDGTQTPEGLPTFRSSNYTAQYPTRAPPATPTKYQPFNGAAPNNTVLAQITLPFPLPTMQEQSNIILGTNSTQQTSDGKSVTLPAALNANSSFNYTPGAVLPSQIDIPLVNSSATNGTVGVRRDSAKQAASTAAARLAPQMVLLNLVGLSLLFNN